MGHASEACSPGTAASTLGYASLWPDAETVWVSDIEKGPIKVLAHRYPDAPNLGDVTNVDWSTVESVDIITGGSPCQDQPRRQACGNEAKTRSGLASMCDAIETLRPSLVIWEIAVARYLPKQSLATWSPAASAWLTETDSLCGDSDVYSETWPTSGMTRRGLAYEPADVGACHGRFRVFVLAWPADTASVGLEWTRSARSGRHGLADGSGGSLVPTPQAHDAVKGKTAAQVAPCEPVDTAWRTSTKWSRTSCQLPPSTTWATARPLKLWDSWTDAMKSRHGNGNGDGKSLSIETQRLLPTPAAQEPGYSGPLVDSDGNSVEHVAAPHI